MSYTSGTLSATGGTITASGGNTIHIYTVTGSNTFVVSSGGNLNTLLVGGGGAGGRAGGGGGGGGVVYRESLYVPSGTYTVVVGTGGPANSGSGNLSSFYTLIAYGGGGGANTVASGLAGASTGGASASFARVTASTYSTQLTQVGGQDVFLIKYGPSGDVLWSARAGSAGADTGNGVATDSTGNVYVTGYYTGTMNLYNSANTFVSNLSQYGGQDVFLVKYDLNGQVRWGTFMGSSGADSGNAVATEPSGNVFVTGYYNGVMSLLGTNTSVQYSTSNTAFVYPPAPMTAATTVSALPTGSYIASASNFFAGNDPYRAFNYYDYTSGWISSTASFAATTGAYTGAVSTTINGSAYLGEWLQIQMPTSVVVKSYKIVNTDTVPTRTPKTWKLVGSTNGTTFVEIDSKTNSAPISGAIITPAPNSNSLAAYTYFRFVSNAVVGTTATSYCAITELSLYSNVGYKYPYLNQTQAFTSGQDAFLAKYDPNGNVLWGARGLSAGTDSGNGVATDSTGNVYMTGNYTGALYLIGNTYVSSSNVSSFVYPPYVMTAAATTFPEGTYTASGSTNTAGEDPFRAFNKSNASPGWTTSTASYAATTGTYAGAVSTTINGSAYLGEWLQIQMPQQIVLNSYYFTSNQTSNVSQPSDVRTPKSWKIAGSIDATTWVEIDSQTSAPTGSIITVPSNSNTNVAYNYFRMAVNQIKGALTTQFCSIGELYLYSNTGWTSNVLPQISGQDVFVAKYGPSGDVLWGANSGSTGTDVINGMALNSQGNVYVTGTISTNVPMTTYASNGVSIPNNILPPGTTQYGFIESLDPSGNVLGTTTIGTLPVSSYNVTSVCYDNFGNIYATGGYTGYLQLYNSDGTLTSPGTVSNSTQSTFLAKYTSNGNVIWSAPLQSTGTSLGNGVATDAAGNVYVTGYYTGPMRLYNSTGIVPANTLAQYGGQDVFLAKYGPSGEVRWGARMGSAGTDTGNGVATDSSGSVYVTGYYTGTMNLYSSSNTLTTQGNPGGTGYTSIVYFFSLFTYTPIGATGQSGPTSLAGYGTSYPGYGYSNTLTVASGVQSYRIEQSGTYSFVVAGAQGGSASSGFGGGVGNVISGNVYLQSGDQLYIVVGQLGGGNQYMGGGGGGTFVFLNSPSNYIFAAGGGGGGGNGTAGLAGQTVPSGGNGQNGSGGQNGNGGAGGTNGAGGTGGNDKTNAFTAQGGSNVTGVGGSPSAGVQIGGGGGGAIGAITTLTFTGGFGGGGSTLTGGSGSFGGGGGAGSGNQGGGGAGGGGGYSGGGGGGGTTGGGGGGGGGGSNVSAFVTGSNLAYGTNTGSGYVIMTRLTVNDDAIGGGGGGAGQSGSSAVLNGTLSTGGNGGNGLQYSISGTPTYYGGGGGGTIFKTAASPGTGGLGGGGSGGQITVGVDGTNGTGGGGGAGGMNSSNVVLASGKGGDGIVIMSYATGTLSATGGTITTNSGNTIHSYTVTGSNTFTVTSGGKLNTLLVGGGGGGGVVGGGGGGGGVVYKESFSISPGTYPVFVGAGGASVSTRYVVGNSGNDSTFYLLKAFGGGGGGGYSTSSLTGGSSGGSGTTIPTVPIVSYTGQLAQYGGQDVFLAKYGPSGDVQWGAYMGSPGVDFGAGVATDATGNVYVTGYYTGLMNLYNSSNTYVSNLAQYGGQDVFLVKYDTNGQVRWGARTGSPGTDAGTALATDVSGNVYVTGYYAGLMNIYNSSNVYVSNLSQYGGQDVFLIKYGPSGEFRWGARTGSPGTDAGNGVAVDVTGNVYVSGYYAGLMNLYSSSNVYISNLAQIGGQDVFVAQYDLNGNVFSVARAGSSGTDTATCIACDPTRFNTVCFGGTMGAASTFYKPQFNTIVKNYTSLSTGYTSLLTFPANPIPYWSLGLKSSGVTTDTETITSSTVDTGANVFVAGYFTGSSIGYFQNVYVSYNSDGTVTSNMYAQTLVYQNAFLTKYNSTGTVLWSATLESATGTSAVNGIASDPDGNVFVTGYYTGLMNLYSSSKTYVSNLVQFGGQDVFLVKYGPNGNVIWSARTGTAGADSGNGIATDATGNVYVTGYYTGAMTLYNSSNVSSSTTQGNIGSIGAGNLGGGGGGAGQPGGPINNVPGAYRTGVGGDGLQYSISGTPTYYAGGGAGGSDGSTVAVSLGGLGGGGAGGRGTVGTAGTDGLGGGGGGGGNLTTNNLASGAGGSGVVIMSYATGTLSATGGTIKTSGGNTIHTYTVTGSNTFIVSTGGVLNTLLVGGGGSGGTRYGGGGGAGGLVYREGVNIKPGTYSVFVGRGGIAGAPYADSTSTSADPGTAGEYSSFYNFTAWGGGEGKGSGTGNGLSQGSTGGGSGQSSFPPSAPTNFSTLPQIGGQDIFLMKYDQNGNVVSSFSAGSLSGTDSGTGVAIDASGNVYMTGYYAGDMVFFNNYRTTFGTSLQGNPGAFGGVAFTGLEASYGGGGGGGAGQSGFPGNNFPVTTAGAGGNGIQYSISGTPTYYAGGGGGGCALTATAAGAGGLGGGGAGGKGAAGTAGTNGLGGGGGGGGFSGATNYASGAGGSGVVIMSYTTGTLSATGGTITTSSGNTIHTFTWSNTFTVSMGGVLNTLLVGGAGSGGSRHGGGGGAGGLVYKEGVTVTTGAYPVVVGSGGASVTGLGVTGNKGTDSYFFGYTALGGGAGVAGVAVGGSIVASNGGSGGGSLPGVTPGRAITPEYALSQYSGQDSFLVKYDALGNVIWSARSGSVGTDASNGVATDSTGNVYMTGYYNGYMFIFNSTNPLQISSSNTSAFNYPPMPMTGSTNSSPLPIGTYTASASSSYTATDENPYRAFNKDINYPPWTTSTGSYAATTGNYAGGFSTTINGSAFLGEWLQLQLPSPIVLTAYQLVNTFEPDRRTPKTYKIAGSNNGSTWIEIDSLTVAPTGINIPPANSNSLAAYNYFRMVVNQVTNTQGTTIFCSVTEWYLYSNVGYNYTNLTQYGGQDGFLAKYDPNGNVLWGVSAVSTGTDSGNGVVTDSSGNVYMTGNYTGNLFLKGNVASSSTNTLFLYPADAMTGASTTLPEGTYTASASTNSTNEDPWRAFNLSNVMPGWKTSTASYAVNGTYTGATSTTINGSAYLGEWLQIQMPQQIVLNSYNLNSTIRNSNLMAYIGYSGYHGNNPAYTGGAVTTSGNTSSTVSVSAATNGFYNNSSTFFSIILTGYYYAPTTGTYTFSLTSDDGSYLWVNVTSGWSGSNLLINNGGNHAPATVTGTISLTGGTYNFVRILMGDNGTSCALSVSVTPPGLAQADLGTAIAMGTSPKNWKIAGSVNATNWVELDSQTSTSTGLITIPSNSNTLAAYSYFRVVVNQVNASNTASIQFCSIDELQLYSNAVQTLVLQSIGGQDVFIAKYGLNGDIIWGARAGSNGTDYSNAISVTSTGNVYMTGTYNGLMNVYSSSNVNTSNLPLLNTTQSGFLVKYDQNGSVQTTNRSGSNAASAGSSITLTAISIVQSNIYVTGYTTGLSVFYTSSGVISSYQNSASQDVFIAKYSQTGNVYWVSKMSSTGADSGAGIATDAAGNVYVNGTYTGPLTIYNSSGSAFSNVLPQVGGSDAFLVKYDTNGNVIWAAYQGSTGTDGGSCIGTDPNGNVYTVGYYTGTMNIYSSSNVSFSNTFAQINANQCVFIAKYSPNGQVLWGARSGTVNTSSSLMARLFVESSGNVYVSGYGTDGNYRVYHSNTSTAFQFGGSGTSQNGYTFKYDPNGKAGWLMYVTNGGNNNASQATTGDNLGNIYVSGYLNSAGASVYSTTFDSSTISLGSTFGGYVLKMNSNGSILSVARVSASAGSLSMVCDSAGFVYILMYYSGATTIYDYSGTSTASLVQIGGQDIAILKMRPSNGTAVWVSRSGSTGTDTGTYIALDSTNSVIIYGGIYPNATTSFYDTSALQIYSSQTSLGGVQNSFLSRFPLV
jgi:hypothetical protein